MKDSLFQYRSVQLFFVNLGLFLIAFLLHDPFGFREKTYEKSDRFVSGEPGLKKFTRIQIVKEGKTQNEVYFFRRGSKVFLTDSKEEAIRSEVFSGDILSRNFNQSRGLLDRQGNLVSREKWEALETALFGARKFTKLGTKSNWSDFGFPNEFIRIQNTDSLEAGDDNSKHLSLSESLAGNSGEYLWHLSLDRDPSGGNYMLDSSGEIYLIRENILNIIHDGNWDEILETRLFPGIQDLDSLNSVRIENPIGKIQLYLVRSEKNWLLPRENDYIPRQEAVREFLELFLESEASSVQRKEFDLPTLGGILSNRSVRIVIQQTDEDLAQRIEIQCNFTKDNFASCLRTGDDTLLRVDKFLWDSFFLRKDSDFLSRDSQPIGN
jgi:hypothetical protein